RLCPGDRAGHSLDGRLRADQPGHGYSLPPHRSAGAEPGVMSEQGRAAIGPFRRASGGRTAERLLLLLAWLIVAALALFVFFAGVLAPYGPIILNIGQRLHPPALDHLFGTDE